MLRFFLVIILAIFLSSCSSQPLDDFHEEGNGLVRSLIETMKPVHTREDLLRTAPKIKNLFNELIDVAIKANDYTFNHPTLDRTIISPEDQALSDALREEMNRICSLEGGREVLEKCQEEALHKLDAALGKQKAKSQ